MLSTFSKLTTMDPRGDIMVLTSQPKRSLIQVSSGPPFTRMPMSLSKTVTRANDKEKFHKVMKCLKIPSKFVKSLTFRALTLWARSRLHEGTNISSWPSIICRNGLKRKRSPPMTPESFAKLLTVSPLRIIPQTSGQVEVSNRGLRRILERTIGQNRASWSDKLDDALWAFCTAHKTPIRCAPYKLMYGKACHLPMELEHTAYWALKQANFNLTISGDHQKIQLNELNELRNIKTQWSGPFPVAKVFPYGTVELSQANGLSFKVNGHRIKHYFGWDVRKSVVPDL
nr:reverse transcriptase domain-containing protein [Tanacetum cinerariifolium]